MDIISKLLGLMKVVHFKQLSKSKKKPLALQRKILLNILKKNSTTDFGRCFHFSSLKSIDAFRKAVPIQTASEYKPLLAKIYNGDHRSICCEKPLFFAMTAGSTGNYKYIPITKSLSQDINRSTMSYLYLFERACPQVKDAPVQFLIGSGEGGTTPGDVSQGYVSGFHYKNLPIIVRKRFVVPYWAFTIQERTNRYYTIIRYMTACTDLAAIISMTPQNICNLAVIAIEQKNRLYKDIKTGGLTLDHVQNQGDRKPSFEPAPDRAELFLTAANAGNSEKAMGILLPSLTCFSTWMGGNMSYATDKLTTLFGPKDIFELPSSASEGIFLIPNEINTPGGIAAIGSHFFEYIHERDSLLSNPATLLVNELKLCERYYLVVTTSGGLYRYNMEDLYEVTGYWGDIPVLKFISKQARQVSITNERINESDVVEAMNLCKSCFGEPPENFILMPNRNSYYDFVVDRAPDNLQRFSQKFDYALRDMSKVYDIYRNDGQIGSIKVHVFAQKSNNPIQQYVESIQFSTSLPSGQFKPLHVSNSVKLKEQYFSTEQPEYCLAAHNKCDLESS